MGGGDMRVEEALGLNCAWYADILLTLTDEVMTAVGSSCKGSSR
jgi:hypothetical protein